jgi:SAM-dependent methyltransferase
MEGEDPVNLRKLQSKWNEAGKVDPFWSVLADPDKKGNRWQVEEFFRTGVEEIDRLMDYIASLGAGLRTGRALDFGCGPGRLTQALGRDFARVDGVDISPSMIELAKQLNGRPDLCHYHVNGADDLRIFPDGSFDFIYTSMTLQHLKPRNTRRYLREFLRVLAPEGLLVFQLPSRPATLSGRLKRLVPEPLVDTYRRLRYGDHPAVTMYGLPRAEVEAWCEREGAAIIDVTEWAPDQRWQSIRYAVRHAATGAPAGDGTRRRTQQDTPAG